MRDGTIDYEAERDRLVEDLSAVVRTFDEYRDILEDADCPEVAPIRKTAQEVADESSAMLKKDRLLRLGIVGQIKAGKSSLLNLLLFDGREVLPKAATPMTASLTHIVHSEELGAGQAEIEVEYYTSEDWQEITKDAAKYQRQKASGRTPEEDSRASHELVEMAARNGVSITDHAAPDIRITSLDDLNRELLELVSAEGKRAPLVKSVTIRCGEGIPYLDIVDTPGLNDPVKSRVHVTDKLLAKCDAVLLLSYAGQFMDSSDVKLLGRKLPQEGIRRCVVIGSKFDSALVDEARTYRNDLQTAADDLEKKLREHAATKSKRTDGDDGRLFNDSDVVFVSAMCAVLGAKRDAGRWSAAEHEAFDTLRCSYPDWLDSPENDLINEDTARNLIKLVGRREHVDDQIRNIQNDKDKIMRDKMRDYLGAKRDEIGGRISALIDALKNYQDELRTGEVEQLKTQKTAASDAIEEIRDAIIDTWSRSLAKQRDGISRTRKSFMEDIDEGRSELVGAVSTKTERRRGEKKSAGFLGLLTLARVLLREDQYESVSYERKVIDETSLHSTLDQAYGQIDMTIHEQLEKMFDYGFEKSAKKEVLLAVVNALNNDIAVNVQRSVRGVLNRAVEKIAEQARAEVEAQTAGGTPGRIELQGSTDSKLSQAREYLNALSDYGSKRLNDTMGIVDETITNAKSELVPVATRDIERHYDRLGQDIAEREFKLHRYQQAIADLQRHGMRPKS